MAKTLMMPKMGFDMEQGKIVRWLKQEGDAVKRGEKVAEIETEKVTIEVENFDDGILHTIVAQAGEDVPVGQPIAVVAQPGEAVDLAALNITISAAPAAETAGRLPPRPLPVLAQQSRCGTGGGPSSTGRSRACLAAGAAARGRIRPRSGEYHRQRAAGADRTPRHRGRARRATRRTTATGCSGTDAGPGLGGSYRA